MAQYPLTPPQVPPRGSRPPLQSEDGPLYYHTCVRSLDEVKQLMVRYVGREGAFIIRNSFSKPGSFTVSVMHDQGIKHFNILKNGQYFFVQDERFNSIQEVVDHFSQTEVPNQEGVKHVRLRHPISCDVCHINHSQVSTPTSPRSFTRSTSNISASSHREEHAGNFTLPRMKDESSAPNGGVCLPSLPSGSKSLAHSHGKSRFSNMFNFRSKSKKHDKLKLKDVIGNRPMLPLPASASEPTCLDDYDTPRDTRQSHLNELIAALALSNPEEGSEKCECGLTMEESTLPDLWSMHISHDDNTRGRLFFMSPSGETSWHMPLEVSVQLCPDDQDRVKNIMSKCADLQRNVQLDLQQNLQQGMQRGIQRDFSPTERPLSNSTSNSSAGQFSRSSNFGPQISGFSNSDVRFNFERNGSISSNISANQRQNYEQGGTGGGQSSLQSSNPHIPQTVTRYNGVSSSLSQSDTEPYSTQSYRDDNSSVVTDLPFSMVPNPPVPGTHQNIPTQHNLYTGSTTGISPGISSASVAVTSTE